MNRPIYEMDVVRSKTGRKEADSLPLFCSVYLLEEGSIGIFQHELNEDKALVTSYVEKINEVSNGDIEFTTQNTEYKLKRKSITSRQA